MRELLLFCQTVERSLRDFDPAVAAQSNKVNRPGVFRGAGIIGGNLAISHRRRLIPVTEGDIVRAGCNQLFAMNEPRTDQPVRVSCFVDIMSVGGGELPSGGSRSRIARVATCRYSRNGPAPRFPAQIRRTSRLDRH